MTQVIGCFTSEGIVLATDSLATWFDQTGCMRHFHLKKILRLGSHSAIVSAGMGVGVEMGLAFQQSLRDRRMEGIEEILRFAEPFFTNQYGTYLRRMGTNNPSSRLLTKREPDDPSPLTGVYLILAGYSFKDRQQPYHLHLMGNGEDETSIKFFPTSHIIVLPRSLSLERRLEGQCREGSSLGPLLSLCKYFLKKRSVEEVGPPFHFTTITRSGFKEIQEEEVEG
jgi:hypothetical protein